MNADTPQTGRPAKTSAERTTSKVRADAKNAGAELRKDATEAVDELRDDAGKIADSARNEIDDAVHRARGVVADQKDLAASQLDSFAQAFDKVAGELGDGQSAAGYARDFAGNLHGLADTMKRNDVDSLLGMAEDYGRKRPGVFLAGAALAGFAASRFMAASSRRRTRAPVGTDSRSTQ